MHTPSSFSAVAHDNVVRVLLIEDSVSDAFIFENLLFGIEECDYLVTHVETLRVAQKLLLEQEFDVILLDLGLPDSRGMETLNAILDATDASVVVLTGSAETNLQRAAIRRGAQDYLPKNRVDQELLRRTIEYAIERQRLLCDNQQALAELARREERMKRMFDQSFDGIAVVDSKGQFLYLNPACEQIFDTSRSLFLGNPNGNETTETTIEIPGPEREENRVVEIRKKSIMWEDEPAWLINIRDISDRMALEEKLRLSQKLESVGRLAGGVAHDFNNQLAAILGFTEFALQESDNNATRESLGHVREAVEKSAALANQLLAFGRKQVLRPESLCLSTELEKLEASLRDSIPNSVQLMIVNEPELARVEIDPTQLSLVIHNLVSNAVDAMPDGGNIQLTTRNFQLGLTEQHDHQALPPGDYVLLTIRDSGVGMDTRTVTQIFEPFFSTKEIGQGSGLGLSSVYGIIKQSHGYVWAHSQPHKGTTFEIYLPQISADDDQVRRRDEDSTPKSESKTILLATDDELLRDIAQGALEQEGHHIIHAENGRTAIEILRELPNPVGIMLADLALIEVSGRELARHVQLEYPDMTMILMSEHERENIDQHGHLNTRTHLLRKPFTPTTLLRQVRQIIATEKFRK